MGKDLRHGRLARMLRTAAACLLITLVTWSAGRALAETKTLRVSHDGRVAVIPVDPDNIQAVRDLLQNFPFSSHGVTAYVFTPVGMLPQLVIAGEAANVQPIVDTIKEMFLETGEKHVVIISAVLRELSDSDIRSLGLNLLPSSIGYEADASADNNYIPSVTGKVSLSAAGTLLQLDESTGRGKIIMSSQVFTPNGVKAEISDVQHVPIFSVNKDGNVQTQFQDLETSIEVTPTVMSLAESTPSAAQVRLEIGVKASIISGEARFQGYTAPQYSDKKFQTTRIFPADGNTYIVGNFVSDSLIKSRSGIPFLSRIPLLKYLFSQETVTKQRSYAVLSLAVRVLPGKTLGDPDTIPSLTSPWPVSETAKDNSKEDASALQKAVNALTQPAPEKSQPEQP